MDNMMSLRTTRAVKPARGGGMNHLTDEILSAYIDGELPPAEAARVALQLTRDPQAVHRLKILRAGDEMLREAFECPTAGQSILAERFIAETERAAGCWSPAALIALAAAGALVATAVAFLAGQARATHDPRIEIERGGQATGGLAHAQEAPPGAAPGFPSLALAFRAGDGGFCHQFAAGAGLPGSPAAMA